jgi:hypothetical protein
LSVYIIKELLEMDAFSSITLLLNLRHSILNGKRLLYDFNQNNTLRRWSLNGWTLFQGSGRTGRRARDKICYSPFTHAGVELVFKEILIE